MEKKEFSRGAEGKEREGAYNTVQKNKKKPAYL